MSDLAGFLAARLDEDEAAAACDEAFRAWWPGHAARYNSRSPVAAKEAFAAGWDAARARVLREVAAKRPILAEHAQGKDSTWCRRCDPGGGAAYSDSDASYPCLTLTALASAWSDHPDFDPAWAAPPTARRARS